MIFKEKEDFVKNYFIPQGFQEVDNLYEGNPKLLINIFSQEVKQAIARGNELDDEFWPDFAIVKRSEVFVQGFQLVKIIDEVRFSLWRILDDGEKFPFICVRKGGKVMRIPEFRKHGGFWEPTSRLLIR